MIISHNCLVSKVHIYIGMWMPSSPHIIRRSSMLPIVTLKSFHLGLGRKLGHLLDPSVYATVGLVLYVLSVACVSQKKLCIGVMSQLTVKLTRGFILVLAPLCSRVGSIITTNRLPMRGMRKILPFRVTSGYSKTRGRPTISSGPSSPRLGPTTP